MNSNSTVTALLQRLRGGDKEAFQELLPLVYQELRRLAAARMKGERPDHTLQPTALVHEAYLRLAAADLDLQSRTHFFAVAAQQMRRIVVDHARSVHAEKRGGRAVKVSLEDFNGASIPNDERVLALDEALLRLEEVQPRAARVVELRFFAGLTEPETAESLGIGISTMKRDWNFARAWLAKELGDSV
jgi:RNA polymerase sigma factor (TIGR02999 family)